MSPSPDQAPAGSRSSVATQFCDAVSRLERERDLEPIVSLYAPRCRVSGVSSVADHEGPDGARAFWDDYRRSFDDMASRFLAVVEAGDHVAIEWETDATVEDLTVTFRGVTVIDVDDGRIARSHAYFDTRDLARHLTRRAPVAEDAESTPRQGSPRGGYVP